jgi:hypothetical protein
MIYKKKTRCIKKNYHENDMNNLVILYLFEHLFFFDFRKTLYNNVRFHITIYLHV